MDIGRSGCVKRGGVMKFRIIAVVDRKSPALTFGNEDQRDTAAKRPKP
jgi:hypothetical protein